jgi:hypothetical protein
VPALTRFYTVGRLVSGAKCQIHVHVALVVQKPSRGEDAAKLSKVIAPRPLPKRKIR